MNETESTQFEVHDKEALANARSIMNASESPRQWLDIARAEGIRHIRGAILPEADNMKHIFQKFGFEIHQVPDSQAIRAEIDL